MLGLQLDGPGWSCTSVYVYSGKDSTVLLFYPQPLLDSTRVSNFFSGVPEKHELSRLAPYILPQTAGVDLHRSHRLQLPERPLPSKLNCTI